MIQTELEKIKSSVKDMLGENTKGKSLSIVIDPTYNYLKSDKAQGRVKVSVLEYSDPARLLKAETSSKIFTYSLNVTDINNDNKILRYQLLSLINSYDRYD